MCVRATWLRRLAVSIAAFAAFLLAARKAARGTVDVREEQAFRAVNRLTPRLHVPAWLVMQAGSLPAVGVAAIAARWRSRSTAAALTLAVNGTAVWALCKVVKRAVGRGRPADHLDGVLVYGAAQRGGGFPSGHAAVSVTLAAVSSRMLPRPAARLGWGIAALVCGARQYVGAHLPLDVAGGAALGLSAGSLASVAVDVALVGTRSSHP